MKKVIIMGAAGRDFHNFNVLFKDNPDYDVIAFTATQIPTIEERVFPQELAGHRYAADIPIYPEDRLPDLIRRHAADLVVFSYSDVSYVDLMHKAAMVQAAGADFQLLGAQRTMLKSQQPVIAVCAVRTGCGKSPTTRKVCGILQQRGLRVVAVRHPMPYGNLRQQVVQRFASAEDLSTHRCTIEEREEYEPLIEAGIVVYAGVDYRRILNAAEQEADIIVWDGGNNDTPFFEPDIHVVLFDPLRAGHELLYYPGETNLRMADIAIINKVDHASSEQIQVVKANIQQHNPQATILTAQSPVHINQPEHIRGKRVLVVEDGPTLTHGGMAYGAGWIAATGYGASHIVDPRPFAPAAMQSTYAQYPHIGPVLPAMGYSAEQIAALEQTINRSDCDVVLFATPARLTRLLRLVKPTVRATYAYADDVSPLLEEVLSQRLHDGLR